LVTEFKGRQIENAVLKWSGADGKVTFRLEWSEDIGRENHRGEGPVEGKWSKPLPKRRSLSKFAKAGNEHQRHGERGKRCPVKTGVVNM